MKAAQMTETTFDRISTREELCEVMDLLCKAGRTEFSRNAGLSASPDEFDVEDVSADELSSLTDLLLGQLERPN